MQYCSVGRETLILIKAHRHDGLQTYSASDGKVLSSITTVKETRSQYNLGEKAIELISTSFPQKYAVVCCCLLRTAHFANCTWPGAWSSSDWRSVNARTQSQSKLVFCECPLNFPPFLSSSLHLFPSLTALTSHFPLCAFSQEIPRMSTPQRSRYPRPLKATQSFTSSSSGTTQPAKSQQQRGSPPSGSGRIGERRSSPERRSPGPILGSSASGEFVGVVCY